MVSKDRQDKIELRQARAKWGTARREIIEEVQVAEKASKDRREKSEQRQAR